MGGESTSQYYMYSTSCAHVHLRIPDLGGAAGEEPAVLEGNLCIWSIYRTAIVEDKLNWQSTL